MRGVQALDRERVVVDLLREFRQRLCVRWINERHKAVQLVTVMLEAHGRRDGIDRPLDTTGPGADALGAGDDDALAVGRRCDEGWVLPRRQETQRSALPPFLHVEHGNRIVVSVGHVERLAIG